MKPGASFRLISHYDAIVPGESAEVGLIPSGSEFYFVDHFPGQPLVPGVIQVEWMAQLATLCLQAKVSDLFPVLLSIRRSQFLLPIRPGDECVVGVKKTHESNLISTFHGQIRIAGALASEADFLVRNWSKYDFAAALGQGDKQ